MHFSHLYVCFVLLKFVWTSPEGKGRGGSLDSIYFKKSLDWYVTQRKYVATHACTQNGCLATKERKISLGNFAQSRCFFLRYLYFYSSYCDFLILCCVYFVVDLWYNNYVFTNDESHTQIYSRYTLLIHIIQCIIRLIIKRCYITYVNQ